MACVRGFELYAIGQARDAGLHRGGTARLSECRGAGKVFTVEVHRELAASVNIGVGCVEDHVGCGKAGDCLWVCVWLENNREQETSGRNVIKNSFSSFFRNTLNRALKAK